jgi:hypothetical protein
MGSQSKPSRLHAIRLISLRAFQKFLLDWPRLTATPAQIRTLDPTSLHQTNRRWPTTRTNFRMDGHTPTVGEPKTLRRQ